MKSFYILTNENKDPNFETTEAIQRYLQKKGCTCYIRPELKGDLGIKYQTNPDIVPADVECVIALGGDGTILRASRNLVKRGIPFMGINLGTLGYLTEGDQHDLRDILERLVADEYIKEDRMMLRGRVFNTAGEKMGEDVALNDLTVNRIRTLRIFSFKLYVNGEFLYLYTADGIVVSTPTGSTAYNLSCGGPVVEPTASLFCVTPIAPHSLNNRSLILSADDKIELEIIGSGRDSEVEYVAYFDGDSVIRLEPGYRIEITRAEEVTSILKLSSRSFLETLRTKMS